MEKNMLHPNKEYWQNPMLHDYERIQQACIPKRDESLDIIIAFMPFAEQDPLQVIDIGAGQGALALKVLRHFPHAHVTLVDVSSTMLAIAKQRLSSYAERITLVEADFNAPDWQKSLPIAVNATVSYQALYYLETDNRLRFFEHVYRRLTFPGYFADGGKFETTSQIIRTYSEKIDVEAARQQFLNTEGYPISAHAVRELRSRHDMNSGANRMCLKDHVQLLETAGFGDVEIVWRYGPRAVIVGYKDSAQIKE
jgi:cyclopropane fatty-acyl-phospholipid synthase-like methyltransferase